jgi:hypothetical protein
MAWDAEFVSLMADTVTINAFVSVSTDGYGTPVFSTAVTTYSARAVREQTLVRTFAGTEELASTTVWIASTSTFTPDTLISVNGSTVGPLMSLSAFPDEDGVHHLKAFFG